MEESLSHRDHNKQDETAECMFTEPGRTRSWSGAFFYIKEQEFDVSWKQHKLVSTWEEEGQLG